MKVIKWREKFSCQAELFSPDITAGTSVISYIQQMSPYINSPYYPKKEGKNMINCFDRIKELKHYNVFVK